MANGGDNIGVYTPLFRTMTWSDRAATLAVFAVGVAVWCALGTWLVSHERVSRIVEKLGEWLVPVVFVALVSHSAAEVSDTVLADRGRQRDAARHRQGWHRRGVRTRSIVSASRLSLRYEP